MKVSEYVLNNCIKHYKLYDINKKGQRPLDKNSIGNEKPKKLSVDNSIFQEIEDHVERFKNISWKEGRNNIKRVQRSI
ncbi:hypothetical protein N3Z16_05335 [Candidatus Megaera polyxenophila]|uniref:hypothetical protein n=1 Tax=Candidatus Megaera polyxenophila TaxID=988779 RepID=UPI00249ECDE8|nr:hypothetical protein N3Z16_05335 [Candidatus Megaera polyxenophila]